MLSRFKYNVTRYPRTAAVVFSLYIIFAVVTSLFAGTTGARYAVLGAVAVVAVLDAVIYFWFMSNGRRVTALIDILNTFEGREPIQPCAICSAQYEEYGECDLSDIECAAMHGLKSEEGQDVAEYAVMLAVMLVIVIGTIRLIGGNAGNVFSQIGSKIGGN